MKNRELMLIVLGIILIGMGVGLFVLSSPESFHSVFYIFPFIFFTTSGNSGLLVLIILIVSLAVFSLIIMKQFSDSFFLQTSMSTCRFCEEPIPQNSRFCPRCGKHIETEGMNH